MADDIDKIIKWARKNGWTVEVNSKGYRYFYPPDATQWVVRYPATPSNPRRRLTEVRTAVKKHGLEWPPPSKGQQQARRRKEGN